MQYFQGQLCQFVNWSSLPKLWLSGSRGQYFHSHRMRWAVGLPDAWTQCVSKIDTRPCLQNDNIDQCCFPATFKVNFGIRSNDNLLWIASETFTAQNTATFYTGPPTVAGTGLLKCSKTVHDWKVHFQEIVSTMAMISNPFLHFMAPWQILQLASSPVRVLCHAIALHLIPQGEPVI